jgi:hypothetical protein
MSLPYLHVAVIAVLDDTVFQDAAAGSAHREGAPAPTPFPDAAVGPARREDDTACPVFLLLNMV